MSILLVGDPGQEVAEAVAGRLVREGDQVRAIVEGDAGPLEALGVHVARGDATNGDLIERAAQGARTIVVFEPGSELLEAAIEGASYARVERLVVCASDVPDPAVIGSRVPSFVLLRVPKPRLLGKSLPAERVALAIDAADDLAGEVRLELDLSDPSAWSALGLDA